jgi:hypothetical protein
MNMSRSVFSERLFLFGTQMTPTMLLGQALTGLICTDFLE